MRALSAITVGLLTISLAGVAGGQSQPAFVVIVHAGNPVQSADRKFIADAFLKKVTRWNDDLVIEPVDMIASSPVRERFSLEVLDRSVAAVKSYWQQLIFSGRSLPGPEVDGSDAVIAYVSRHAGAIGYVSSTATLRGVKILKVR